TTVLWDASTGQRIAELTGHTAAVTAIAFNPSSSLLATASKDHTVRLWDAGTGEPIGTLTGHTDRVNAVAFSPDGRVLVSAAGGGDETSDVEDDTVRLWDTTTGRESAILSGHTNPVTAIAFSPDGRTLATGGGTVFTDVEDDAVRLWD